MSGWPNNHVERLKVLWAEGLSASQVSTALCREFADADYGRSAVIGKVHRLKLPKRPRDAQIVASRVNARAARAATPPRPPKPPRPQRFVPTIAMAAPVLPISLPAQPATEADFAPAAADAFAPLPGSEPRTLVERPFGACAWPVGENDEGEALFCCLPRANRWCAAHDARNRAKAPKSTAPKDLARSLRRWIAA